MKSENRGLCLYSASNSPIRNSAFLSKATDPTMNLEEMIRSHCYFSAPVASHAWLQYAATVSPSLAARAATRRYQVTLFQDSQAMLALISGLQAPVELTDRAQEETLQRFQITSTNFAGHPLPTRVEFLEWLSKESTAMKSFFQYQFDYTYECTLEDCPTCTSQGEDVTLRLPLRAAFSSSDYAFSHLL